MKILKKLKIVLLVVFTISLISCNSDDNDSDLSNTEQNRSNLIGVWKLTNTNINGIDNELSTCDLLQTITFTETTVQTKSYYNSSDTGIDCTIDGNYTRNYTIDGSTISVIIDGGTFTEEITQLTDSQLKLKIVYEDEDNTGTNITVTEIATYQKQ